MFFRNELNHLPNYMQRTSKPEKCNMKKNKPGIEASYLSKFQEKKNNFVSVISTRYSRRHEKMKKMGGGGGTGRSRKMEKKRKRSW
jgi:hypothetical protein